MTSLDDHAGRPEVQPWVRGWTDDEPQTSIVWRNHLPLRDGDLLPRAELDEFLDAAPPHAMERLETESWRALDWLLTRAAIAAKRSPEAVQGEVIAVLLPSSGDATSYKLEGLARAKTNKRARDVLERKLPGATLLVDLRLGGLRSTGLLDDECDQASDVGDLAADHDSEHFGWLPFRVRLTSGDDEDENAAWRPELRLTAATNGDGDAVQWMAVESRVDEQPESEEGRSVAARAQLLEEHQAWAERRARSLAERLCLPQPWASILALAARLHDEGKRARRWQRAFRAEPGGPWGKTTSRPSQSLLDGYRHEFGSLPIAERDPRVQDLDPERRDLLLHLIAAHHGKARPVISTRGCEDAPPSALVARARAVALRFTLLEARWGPWGLAWWEALLRAADVQASRENDERGGERG
jgi:CRISPR-associated endonuclease/helicase Cas3